MTIYVEFDKEANKVDLYSEGELLKQFTPQEAWELIQEVDYLKTHHKHELVSFNKVKLVDLEEKVEELQESLENIKSINFEIIKVPASFPECRFSLALEFEDGKEEKMAEVTDILSENFDESKIWFGQISSHEIRACMHESLNEFLRTRSSVDVKVCGRKVSKAVLLNEERVEYFEATTC